MCAERVKAIQNDRLYRRNATEKDDGGVPANLFIVEPIFARIVDDLTEQAVVGHGSYARDMLMDKGMKFADVTVRTRSHVLLPREVRKSLLEPVVPEAQFRLLFKRYVEQ